MKEYGIRRFSAADADAWDRFISASRNGTFLFRRGFMDYHKDRFTDHSLVFLADGKWLAVLPAHQSGTQLFSHRGLSYGGLIFGPDAKLENLRDALLMLPGYLSGEGITQLQMTLVPHLYHQMPSEETAWILTLLGAKLTRRDALSVIDLREPLPIPSSRMEGVKKALKLDLFVDESDEIETFWEQLLLPNLEQRHEAKPVHSAQEMKLLKDRFPHNIRCFIVREENRLLAGCVVFETETVAHVQYIASDTERNRHGALDLLHHHLITETFAHKRWFDFGSSRKGDGVDSGLLYWKESFGARTIVQDSYVLEIQK